VPYLKIKILLVILIVSIDLSVYLWQMYSAHARECEALHDRMDDALFRAENVDRENFDRWGEGARGVGPLCN